MTGNDRDIEGRPGALSSNPTPMPADGGNTAQAPDVPLPESEGLASHFVRRTDNDFHGIDDPSLIGQDIGDDLFDENGDPIEE
jgi:hypothetical protein